MLSKRTAVAVIGIFAGSIGLAACGGGGDSSGGAPLRIAIAQSPFTEEGAIAGARVAIVSAGDSPEDPWTEVASFSDTRSNVFHKALPFEGVNGDRGILTIGGNQARLLLWSRGDGGEYESKELWSGDFGGNEISQRLRDIEVGDVDGDGQDEIVLVTHDRGVVMIGEQKDGGYAFTEIDRIEGKREDGKPIATWIHEVELGDVDGDGAIEILCTPSAPNVLGSGDHQPGQIAMFDYVDGEYEKRFVFESETTHAKEILAFDILGQGHPQLLAAMEGEGIGGVGGASSQVWLFRYENGEFRGEKMRDLPGDLCRFLNGGDTDGDGQPEIVASTAHDGIFTIWQKDGEWSRRRVAKGEDTGGFEHATILVDLDGDGADEIIAASDDSDLQKLQVFDWDGKTVYERRELMPIGVDGFYWNLSVLPEGI